MKDIWKKARQIFTWAGLGIAAAVPAYAQSEPAQGQASEKHELIPIMGENFIVSAVTASECGFTKPGKTPSEDMLIMTFIDKDSEALATINDAYGGWIELRGRDFFENKVGAHAQALIDSEILEVTDKDVLWDAVHQTRKLRDECIARAQKTNKALQAK